MRIAFVNATRKWGGVKTWCLDMAVALRAQGHETWVFGRPGEFVAKAGRLGLSARAVRFGIDFSPLLVLYFIYFFLTRRVNVVVLNVAKDLRTAGVAARLLGLQVVQHVGSGGDFDDVFLVRLCLRLLRPRLLCCSNYVSGRIQAHVPSLVRMGIEIAVIHPGVAVPAAPAFADHTPPVVMAASQLNEDKCHADLLDALARLKEEGIAFRAVIAGAGALEWRLKEQSQGLGLGGLVEWTGFVADVPALLARGDVFVLPSLIEPLGIALEEAMAAGLAPVGRGAGGVPEIWPECCRKFLVGPEPGAQGIAGALRALLSMPAAERMALRRGTWEHARTCFGLPGQGARFAQWLAQGRGSPGE